MQFEVNTPTNIIIGIDAIEKLPLHINSRYKKLLIVSNKELGEHVKKAVNVLDELSCSINNILLQNAEPSTDFIDSTATDLKQNNFDLIIGIGGGSAIDMAKALAIALKNPEPIWNYANLSNRPASKFKNIPLPVIAIPTTSGTGAEVTPYAVLTKLDTQQKGTIQEKEIFPKVAIIDPTFLVTMPAELTAYTGLDTFAHAFESYINISKPSPYAEMVACKAMELVFNNLKIAVNDGSNLEARINMAWASSLAGIAIAHRGTTTAHAIAEPLGALTKLPHAVTVVLSTLPVIKHTFTKENSKFKYLLNNLNFKAKNERDYDFIVILEKLINDIGCGKKLIDFIAIDKNLSGQLLKNVLKYKFRPLKLHPIEFNESEMSIIIKEVVNA